MFSVSRVARGPVERIDVDGILARNRRALSKALTLVESSNPAHAADIGILLRRLSSRAQQRISAGGNGTGATPAARLMKRIAVSGSPGAGKSCYIEALGMHLVGKGNRVGVIAVDPSSVVTGGSILGDKTRMDKLSVHESAYIRPSPSRGHLGGVTARGWESMQILEAAQFDVIVVETVGVGQSEIAVRDMTDVFVLLVPPAAGDELQGIKKGIVEIADAIIVTKDDGEREKLAQVTKAAYSRAVQYRTNMNVAKPVLTISSDANKGIAESWATIEGIWNDRYASGQIDALRKAQKLKHFRAYFENELVERAWRLVSEERTQAFEDKIVRGTLAPREAAEIALAIVLGDALKSDRGEDDSCF